mmetsp:Transcript_12076/g.17487  ORF Transcript_12076/g.17487 Transcript_12076/m.17487 type:complete len:218 (-) Transcript_12076:217-870(-)
MVSLISSMVVGFARRAVRSTTETSGVGTRKAMPVNFPLSSGMTFPTALAAPVEDGMMFAPAPRPPLQSFCEGPSTVFWVAVVAWTVVIKPSTMPKLSLMTFARGARQLVVQDALERTVTSFVYSFSFTPHTNMGASAEGAEITTFLAPPVKCAEAFSLVVKTPVDSTTYSAPHSPHGISCGSLLSNTAMECPATTSLPPSVTISPGYFPCVESYLNM